MILDTFSKLETLKKERNAIILAHYHQDLDIQDAADFMSDSLVLAKQTTQTNVDIILFYSVHFMCETAKILNPEKQVIFPDINDGCACNECPYMRLNTLEKIVEALEKMKPEITLPEGLRIQVQIPFEKMLALS